MNGKRSHQKSSKRGEGISQEGKRRTGRQHREGMERERPYGGAAPTINGTYKSTRSDEETMAVKRQKPVDPKEEYNRRECPERPECWMLKTFCERCGKCKEKRAE